MKTYLEISISCSETQREMLLPTMIELGCEGFQETETDLIAYIDGDHWDSDKDKRFRSELSRLFQTISSNAAIRITEVQDRDWNEQWEKTVQPIEIGRRLVIKPSWAAYENTDNRIVIEIDPKMAFGTGYHETTRLVLRLLEKYLQPGDSVLDVGTGTGILVIAAVKYGAISAYGIDIDEWSIDNATENIRRNRVAGPVRIDDTRLEDVSGEYTLITANLTLKVNSFMLPQFRRLLTPNGIVLLSGLLDDDDREMCRRLAEEDFEILERIAEQEWIALSARKKQEVAG